MPKEVPVFQPQGFSNPNLTAFNPVHVSDTNAFSQVLQVAGSVSNRLFDAAYGAAKEKTVVKAERQATIDVLDGNIDASQLDETNITFANQAYVQRAGTLVVNKLMLDYQKQDSNISLQFMGDPDGYAKNMQAYMEETAKDLPPALQAHYITNAGRGIINQHHYLSRVKIANDIKAQTEELEYTEKGMLANIPRLVQMNDPAMAASNAAAYEQTLIAQGSQRNQIAFKMDAYYNEFQKEQIKQQIGKTDTLMVSEAFDKIEQDYADGKYPNLLPSDIDDLRAYSTSSFNSREAVADLKTNQEKALEERVSILSKSAAFDFIDQNPTTSQEEVIKQAEALYPSDIDSQNDFIRNAQSRQITLADKASKEKAIDPLTTKGQSTIASHVIDGSTSPTEMLVKYNHYSDQFGTEIPGVFQKGLKILDVTTDIQEAENMVTGLQAIASEHPSAIRGLSDKDQARMSAIRAGKELLGLSNKEIAKRVIEGGIVSEEEVKRVHSYKAVRAARDEFNTTVMQQKFSSIVEDSFRITGDMDVSVSLAREVLKNQQATQKIRLGAKEQNVTITGIPLSYEPLTKNPAFQSKLSQVLTQQIASSPLTRSTLQGKPVGEAVKILSLTPMEGQPPSVVASGDGRYVMAMNVNGQLIAQENVSLKEAFDKDYYTDLARAKVKDEHNVKHKVEHAVQGINFEDPINLNVRAAQSRLYPGTLAQEANHYMRPVSTAYVSLDVGVKKTQKMHRTVAPHFESLAKAFHQQTGAKLPLSSIHRSHAQNLGTRGSATYSGHMFGITFDVTMDKGSKFSNTLLNGKMSRSELVKLARKHGFAPNVKGDPNHFAYIGK